MSLSTPAENPAKNDSNSVMRTRKMTETPKEIREPTAKLIFIEPRSTLMDYSNMADRHEGQDDKPQKSGTVPGILQESPYDYW